MKTHTNSFKSKIKEFGRELSSKITYTISGTTTELGPEQLNSVSPHYEGAILKSVMKQLDIDSNVEIPVGTELNYQFGVKVNGSYEYIDYGNYIVKEIEKQEDKNSWKITCYDKMLYSMKDYESLGITYPITVRNYINAICTKIGLTFANLSDNFANYDKIINNELYLDTAGRSMGYTYRTVLDELAEVTASTICINDNDKLEIRYINDTIGNNLVDFTKLSVTNDTTYTWQDYVLTVQNTTGTYKSARASLLDIVKNNPGKSLRVDYDSIDFSQGHSPGVSLQITNNGTTTYPVIVGSSGTITNYTIPNDTSGITVANIRFMPNNTSTSQAGKIVITKPIVHIGTTKIPFEPYGDTIDEEYLKDVNVNFGEKFGPVNTIVLSRGGDGDKISLSNPTNLPDADKIAIQITDNQIMNGNDRDTYMSDILTKLYGLEYYINDYTSTGICYYDVCDRYNVKIDNKFYSCIMFNDSVEVTQGLKENIYVDMPEENEQQYKYIGSTDRGITQANIIANKAEATITQYTQQIDDLNNRVDAVETKQTATDYTIGILSTNIDENGNITEVTTTTGFTFNADGMTISNSETDFTAQHTNEGTYYYDGSTIVGQYTKEGSLQKDLHLFGVYYYGMRTRTDTPMFVAQLYTDENNTECFGHFYNRGD